MDRDEPVVQGQLASVHDSVSLQALSVMTMLALKALLVTLPVIFCAFAVRTYDALPLTVLFQLELAALLVGETPV